MDFKNLSEKYIGHGIEWLTGEFDTYKGMTTIIETEEDMTEEQLDMLCEEIKKDNRVKMAMVENVKESTITIIFCR